MGILIFTYCLKSVIIIRRNSAKIGEGIHSLIKYLTEKEIQKYESFVSSHPKGHFMQSVRWAGAKRDWKNVILVCEDENGTVKGGMSVLIRKVPVLPYKLMYCPRGPVCDIYDESTIKELTQAVCQLAKKEKAYVLKIDPDVLSSDKKFENIMKNCGYTVGRDVKNFEGVQPRYVFRLTIKDKNEQEIMEIFHPKTRYNIRLAIKKGVTARVGNREDLADFHRIMVETGDRDDFIVRNLAYFQAMFDAMGTEHLRLYIMEYEGKVVAGSIAIYYGNKVWYLYGASSNESRRVMPNYLMQWEMIKWAMELKCEIYDFRGVSGDISEDNPLYGLYRFKKGFNGEFTEFISELSYIHKPLVNIAMQNLYKLLKIIRSVSHKSNAKGKSEGSEE